MILDIVVDVQKDFITGALANPQAQANVAHLAETVKAHARAGHWLFLTRDTHPDNYLATREGRHLPVEHCIEGAPGHALYGRIAELIRPTDEVFEKPSFGSADLFEWLRAAQPPFKSIELVGLVSNICVISNAVLAKAACPEVPVIVDAACTASFDDSLNEKALDVLEGLQVQVTNR